MSPRAACRLESLGFTDVYDYAAGKSDWLAAGLPREGSLATQPTIGDLAHTDVPTCGLEDRIGAVADRVEASEFDNCYVITEDRCVLGELTPKTLREADREAAAGDVLNPGPSTFRPNVPLEEMANYMREHDLSRAPITTSEGKLIGLLLRADIEKRLER